MKKNKITQALKDMRGDQTQQQLAMELNVSRESVTKYETGDRNLPKDISQSLMSKKEDPFFAFAIRNEYTKTGPVRLNGPNFDSHRSAVREKTIEEVEEALESIQSFSFAKPLQNISEWERPKVEVLVEQTIEAITALETLLATVCAETNLSHTQYWGKHYNELRVKGFLQ